MIWQYNPLMIPLGVAGCVCLSLIFICGRYIDIPGVRHFNLLMLALTFWILTYALELGAVGLAHKRLWSIAQYLAIPFVPLLWLTFLMTYAGHRHLLTPWRLVLLALIPLLTAVLAVTNQFHGLVLKNAWLANGPLVTVLVREFGLWFWVHSACSYILLAGGCLVIFVSIARAPEDYRGRRASLLLACILPWFGNAVFILGIGPRNLLIDPTPFILTLSGLLIGWSVFQGRLFDIVPIGHDTVIRNMPDGVIILDAEDRVLDINRAALQLLHRPSQEILGQPASNVLGPCLAILAYGRQQVERIEEIELTIDRQSTFFDLDVTPIRRENSILARLFVLRNVTARREALEDKLHGEKLKGALETAGAICHKLNQPLQGILGNADLLMLKSNPADDGYAKIRGIQAEAAKMGEITKKLLGITRYRTARYTAGEIIVDIERSSGDEP